MKRTVCFFSVIAIALLTTTAIASTLTFTDRASFDAVAGPTTLLTFDTLPPPTITVGFLIWNFDGSFRIASDGAQGIDSFPGTVCFCNVPNGVVGGTADPVVAIGLDITPLIPNAQILIDGATYIMSEPQFLGFLYTEPSRFSIQNVFALVPPGGLAYSSFTIDNVEIRGIPEPSSFLFLACGIGAFIVWRWRVTAATS